MQLSKKICNTENKKNIKLWSVKLQICVMIEIFKLIYAFKYKNHDKIWHFHNTFSFFIPYVYWKTLFISSNTFFCDNEHPIRKKIYGNAKNTRETHIDSSLIYRVFIAINVIRIFVIRTFQNIVVVGFIQCRLFRETKHYNIHSKKR